MTALDLIQIVEANGGHLRVEDGWLVIAPGEAAAPVMEELRKHKAELIAELARRPAMPAGVRSDEKFDESPGCEPPKPSEPTFEGFEGSTSGQMQNFSDAPPPHNPQDRAVAPVVPDGVVLPDGVRLVRWEPVPAPVRLSPCSTVTDVDLFIRATLRQLEAALEGRNWQAGNWGLSGLIERLAACGCGVVLDDPRKALQ